LYQWYQIKLICYDLIQLAKKFKIKKIILNLIKHLIK